MVATYAVEGDSFRADRPRVLAETRTLARAGGNWNYALHPDGERFAIARPPEETATKQDKVVFIFNFFDELRRIAPTIK